MIGRTGWTSVRLFGSTLLKGGLKPALLFAIQAGVFAQTPGQPIAIRWLSEGVPPAVEVEGVPREVLEAFPNSATATYWGNFFAVFAEQGGATPTGTVMPPMMGKWSVANNRLRFEPLFPLTRGVRYRAEFRMAGKAPTISFFELPADTRGPTTTVAQIFPSAALLPENQLKFYVQFSAPMRRGGAYDHLRLSGADGRAIELPFLELDEELWDPTMTRLTLLIDPGRIKRGVKPLEDIGSVFEAGKRYTLSVAAGFRDAEGLPLRTGFEKTFQVGAADRTPIDPTHWTIRAPRAGTLDALMVEFGEPLDQALALRLIGVAAENGKGGEKSGVHGKATLGEQERRWNFDPAQPWRPGRYFISVVTTIEDLAGNNVGKAFDVDLAEGVQRKVASESVTVPFEVR